MLDLPIRARARDGIHIYIGFCIIYFDWAAVSTYPTILSVPINYTST